MSHNPNYVIEVAGSRDPSERDSVSAGRIRSVVTYLQRNGISLRRIMEKDYQGSRPGVAKDAQRNVTFQYFSTAREDVVKTINSKNATSSNPSPVTITTGSYAEGESAYLNAIEQWKVGTTFIKSNNKPVAVIIDRIEPARAKTFAEARGTVINEYPVA